jgi:UDP-2-acetamido-3-amino-2,3-dideoxy-glucuronate N-acetyltransferase
MTPTNFIDGSARVGEDTVVWHFAVIQANVVIGKRCSIGSGAEIGKGSTIGNYSRISAHVFLPANSVIGERCFLGPGVVATDDRFPRASNPGYIAMPPVIEDGASIGAGAILLPGVHIGVGALVAAGAIVTRDVEAHSHVRGEPARVKAYSQIHGEVQRLVAENAAPWPGVSGS